MRMTLATMLQSVAVQADTSQVTKPVYADSNSIWHHMSGALNESLYRVLSLLIAILPGILAFFVALAVFTAIGMLLSALLRRGLTWAKFDDRLSLDRGADW